MKTGIKNLFILFLILPVLLILYINPSYAEKETEKAIYTYQQNFRNPFSEYTKERVKLKNDLSIESLKSQLTFKLKGIINYGNNKIAIIDSPQKTRFIKDTYFEEGFKILNIEDDRILIKYQNISFYMMIGGKLVASEK